MRLISPLLATTMLCALAPITTAAQSPVARIVVTPAAPTLEVCGAVRLQAVALDASGQPVPNAVLRFQATRGFLGGPCPSQSAAAVADGQRRGGVPDAEGIIVGHSNPGHTVVTVTAMVEGRPPFIHRLTIPIEAGPATRILVEPIPARLVTDQEISLRTESYSAENHLRVGDRVTWTSSAERIARVDEAGVLRALGPGRATITATSGSARRSFQVEVVPAGLRSLSVAPAKSEVKTGDVVRFAIAATDAGGRPITGLMPRWSFSPGEGRIDPDGGFVAYEPGTYSVTAIVGQRAASATVTVKPREVRRVGTIVGAVPIGHAWTAEVALHPTAPVAYLSMLDKGLGYVIDVSNPAEPVIVDSVVTNARVSNDISVSEDGKVLIISREVADNRRSGITIYTLDDPRHPKLAADFTDPVASGVHSATINTQAKFGRFVYCTNYGKMVIVDINDPANPKVASTFPMAGLPHDYFVDDGIAYASWISEGLLIFDVGNGIKGGTPQNPRLITHYRYDLAGELAIAEKALGTDVIGGTHAAWRHGKYLFLGDEIFNDAFTGRDAQADRKAKGQPPMSVVTLPERFWSGLRVLDVSDLEHPKPVASYRPEFGGIHNFSVAGDTLYLATFNAGFRAFDISGELRGDLRAQGREITHVNPVDWRGKKPNAANTFSAVVKDGLTYVTDMHNGLFIVRMEPKPVLLP
jgi:hypothetical protein